MLDLTLESTRNYIYSIDFSLIIERLHIRERWLRQDAEATCEQYRKFLFLIKKYGENFTLAPSEDIDEFWHHHILDTQNYLKDCKNIFGRYLHHNPFIPNTIVETASEKTKNGFAKLQELYHKEYGEYIYATKSKRFFFEYYFEKY